MMKNTITYTDIINYDPCYDPTEIGMSKDYKGTIPEFIKEYRSKVKDKQDILWVVLKDEYMTKNEFLEFSLFSANRVKHLMQDKRSLNALRVLELYLKDEATEEELKTASAQAAYDDAADAAHAAYDAANAAYDDAADAAHAAYDAADAAHAAYAAAYADNAANAAAAWAAYAANAAAYAAYDASYAAAYASADASANTAAADAMWHEKDAQIDKLIEIFEKRKTLGKKD